jgi:hypothetical protein
LIDALLYAVRDAVRAAGINYGYAECEVRDDGKPPPRCGNVFVAVHGGKSRGQRDNQLFELIDYSVTVTMRLGSVSIDRVGEQLIARNIVLAPIGYRQGFNAKVEQLRAFLHMNWAMTVLPNQTPNSANDNIAAWATGTVYGFCEPARYQGAEISKLVGGEWFAADPDVEDFGVKAELQFAGAKRFQPQTLPMGPFV